MELDRLEYFLNIVETGSFSAAAEKMHTIQPSVSKQLAHLEQELGARLFDRTHRTIILTPQGEALLPRARAMMEHYREIQKEMQQYRQKLRLDVFWELDRYGLRARLEAFQKAHPEIELLIRDQENIQIPLEVKALQCDAAICYAEDSTMDSGQILTQDELVLLVPAGHPLTRNYQPVMIDQLMNETIILMGQYSQRYQEYEHLFRDAQVTAHMLYTGCAPEHIARLVAQGSGIALLMHQVAQSVLRPDTVILRITPTLTRAVVLVCAVPDHMPVQQLKKYLCV